mmetsp:Transcript_33459/g.92653  ORF Transcript_33459/g.92653 Transcript_33459/m.92653 type:complete len:166 (-) Transcript_33459:3-500(-)
MLGRHNVKPICCSDRWMLPHVIPGCNLLMRAYLGRTRFIASRASTLASLPIGTISIEAAAFEIGANGVASPAATSGRGLATCDGADCAADAPCVACTACLSCTGGASPTTGLAPAAGEGRLRLVARNRPKRRTALPRFATFDISAQERSPSSETLTQHELGTQAE